MMTEQNWSCLSGTACSSFLPSPLSCEGHAFGKRMMIMARQQLPSIHPSLWNVIEKTGCCCFSSYSTNFARGSLDVNVGHYWDGIGSREYDLSCASHTLCRLEFEVGEFTGVPAGFAQNWLGFMWVVTATAGTVKALRMMGFSPSYIRGLTWAWTWLLRSLAVGIIMCIRQLTKS